MFVNLLKYMLIAVVQGISEILPISSSCHIILLENIFHISSGDMSLAIFLHFGSLIALIVYYHKILYKLINHGFNYCFKKTKTSSDQQGFNLLLMMFISIVPCGIVGILFKSKIETIFKNPLFIAINLLITALLLLKMNNMRGTKKLNDISYKEALTIGLFQTLGVLPGISRSGVTLFAAKNQDIENESATNYAFLLFIPIALGTFILEIISIINGSIVLNNMQIILYIISTSISGIVTYFSLHIFLKIIKRGKLYYFSYYCLLLSLLIVLII